MKIFTATPHFFGDVSRLFTGHTVEVLPKDKSTWKTLEGDLLVLTGGEDVQPSHYGRPNPKSGWFDPRRDLLEFEVMNAHFMGRLKFKKVLGICRGLQLLNVVFSGTLHYDIPTSFGKPHDYYHPLAWKKASPLQEVFPVVNSLHHQGVENVGGNAYYRVLAVEPNTAIPEVVLWDNKFLGVQFHPELMPKGPAIDTFVTIMEEWTMGNRPLELDTPIKDKSRQIFDWKFMPGE